MNTEPNNTTLIVSGIRELTAATASDVKSQVRLHFTDGLTGIDLDCSALDFLDSSGLGTLISLQKIARERGGSFRLLSPRPGVLQVLELTRLHRVFEIIS